MIHLRIIFFLFVIKILSKFVCNSDSFDFNFKTTNERSEDLLGSLVSGVQLGLKNVMNNILPSVEIPAETVHNKNDRLKIADVTLPSILGGRLGCPKCKSVDTTKLFGSWRVVI